MSNMSMIIPYRKKGTTYQFLLKNETIVGWDQHPDLCGIAIAGPDEVMEKGLVDKLKADLGFVIEPSDFIHLGVCAMKRASEHICYLYAVDLTKRVELDESKMGDYLWAYDDKLMESIDSQLLACYARLRHLVL